MSEHVLTIEQGGTSYSADVSSKSLKLSLPLRAQCSCGWSTVTKGSHGRRHLGSTLNWLNEDWRDHVQAVEAGQEHWLHDSNPYGDSFSTSQNDPFQVNMGRLRAYLNG